MKPLILASASPRRQELMKNLGLSFEIMPSDVDEHIEGDLSPDQIVEQLALRKAEHVALHKQSGLVIGSDTIVVHNGLILGKPRDNEEAFHMLSQLQNQKHVVYTGVAIVDAATGKKKAAHQATIVKIKMLTNEHILRYISTGEYYDKAGSYAIQGYGATLVSEIEGDYFTVVGLPLSLLSDMLEDFGVEVLPKLS
ncbi:MAG: Maf family protein [Bacilli bacterium]